ncbi:uncharacterized protein Dwil_GK18122 [Drosophila willistoni]|uniref:MADF domain-containing protein n=1 Tax=Drosophila willistoni TaxID=7260 RepID=B4MZA2_DROWI|nr:uncharacterized protein LOC6643689 [Drosophila willistoni]EDW77375.1 uncharacterized protein Dwil_GK18122 [Drosophila willistoni]
MDDLQLVKLIETFSILYDKDSARTAKNMVLKDEAWKKISQKLKASERACITRWKSLRDRFGKEFRRFQENPEEPTNWDIFPHLLFLKDHYKHGLNKNENLDKLIYQPKEKRRRLSTKPIEKKSKPKDSDADKDYGSEEDFQEDLLNQQLIELVKMHPVLYDRHQIRVSKNLSAKNEAWHEISESLNVSEEVCYNRWKKLRDRFAREYRNQQINPNVSITWRHFNDLLFLDRHFRKGVPLVLQNIKKRGRPPKVKNLETTKASSDYNYSTDNDILLDEENNEELEDGNVEEIEVLSASDLILNQSEVSVVTTTTMDIPSTTSIYNSIIAEPQCEESEINCSSSQILTTVIANMETVLQQTKEMQNQLELEQQQQLPTCANSFLSKSKLLLDGLSPTEKRSAERKIVQFLCECQMKTLDGEEIEDVKHCQFT